MSEATKKKSLVPWIFVAFFAVVLAVNATMIYIALSSWTGLETRNAFVKGRDYNEILKAVQDQNSLGWTVSDTVTPVPGEKGTFRITLTVAGPDGKPVSLDKAVIWIERPTHTGIDIRPELTVEGPGQASTVVHVPEAGQWFLRRLIWSGEHTHQTVERIFLKTEWF